MNAVPEKLKYYFDEFKEHSKSTLSKLLWNAKRLDKLEEGIREQQKELARQAEEREMMARRDGESFACSGGQQKRVSNRTRKRNERRKKFRQGLATRPAES